MEELDIKELWEFFRKKIGFVILIVSAFCLIGCLYGLFIQKPMYSSYTTVVLGSSDSSSATSITQSEIQINQNLVSTYAEIIKSRRILSQVIENLDLDVSYESLSKQISVSALNNTEIIKISVTNASPKVAKDIANSTAKYFTSEIKKIYNIENASILDKATTNNTPSNINVTKQIIICFLLGFVLSFGVLFIIFYFDRTLKSVEQLEQKIKLPVLGSVQDCGRGAK